MLGFATPRGFVFSISKPRTDTWFALAPGGKLVPATPLRRQGELVGFALSARKGVEPEGARTLPGSCPVTARDVKSASVARAIEVSLRGHPTRSISGGQGAGLAGLPLP